MHRSSEKVVDVINKRKMTNYYFETNYHFCLRWRRKQPLSLSERRSTKNQLLDSYMTGHQQQSTERVTGSLSANVNYIVCTTTSDDGRGRPSSNAVALDENSRIVNKKQCIRLDEVCPLCVHDRQIGFANGSCSACSKQDRAVIDCQPSLSFVRKKGQEAHNQSTYLSNDFLLDPLTGSDQPSFRSKNKNFKLNHKKLNITENVLFGPDVTSHVSQSSVPKESRKSRYGSLLD